MCHGGKTRHDKIKIDKEKMVENRRGWFGHVERRTVDSVVKRVLRRVCLSYFLSLKFKFKMILNFSYICCWACCICFVEASGAKP